MARILIVDDDDDDRVGLCSILEQAGHTVVAIIAISGKSPGQLAASKVFGARSVLTKPIDKDEFLATVGAIVGTVDEASS